MLYTAHTPKFRLKPAWAAENAPKNAPLMSLTLLWTFRLPWHFAAAFEGVPAWAAQFAFGFYSVMFTSSFLGLVMMLLFKPRAWCAVCPMGTMTQAVCKVKHLP